MDDPQAVDGACDHCQEEATLFCSKCKSSYCSTCSSVRHRAEKRKDHFVVRISKLYTTTRVLLDEDPPKSQAKKVNYKQFLVRQKLIEINKYIKYYKTQCNSI